MSDGPFYGIQRDCDFIEEKYKVKIRKTWLASGQKLLNTIILYKSNNLNMF